MYKRQTQAPKADVDEVLYVPAALALHQRPGVPGIRSTFGTGTELLNSLRLMYSRLASHRCPNGHYLAPTLAVAAGQELICPECGARFYAPSAEELAFNSQGACRTCGGTGTVQTVDRATLVPDESLTIDEGAVAPWNSLMWSLMTDVCRAMGVRTDVPFRDLTDVEKEIVYDGPAEKKHIFYHSKNSEQAGELDFTYYSAVRTVENALSKVKDEKGMKRVEKFLRQDICPDCGGSRLCAAARAPRLQGIPLDEACRMTLSDLVAWVSGVPAALPEEMRPMAQSICESFQTVAKRLMDLGLGYLALDRAAATLSTGERQRMQLARAVRNRTTGVLYVLDEPSIGLHPANITGLTGVMQDLIHDGNSVILVDHDTQILSEADWLIEMGPQAGAGGGQVIAQGSIPAIEANAASRIGPFLAGKAQCLRPQAPQSELFALGRIQLSTNAIHTVKPLDIEIPKGRLTVVTGVSGSGKTTIGRAICRINPTSGGDIFFKGQKINGKISKELDREVIRKVQMIFQDPMASLNERAKVEYIVAEGLLNHHLYKDQDDLHEKVMNALHEVGLLPEFASRFPHEFSGGQRQRIGIARALVMEPEFIVADEPISALDVSIRAQVLNLLNSMKKSRGLTYLFIAHDLSVVRFISDRIAVISKGRIVELAEAEELFLHPLHPYTKALLSAVPIPDPGLEKKKKLLVYDPSIHDYSVDKPVWEEIANGHFVYGNQKELEGYRKEYQSQL